MRLLLTTSRCLHFRRWYDQLCRGITTTVSRNEIEDRFSRVRNGIEKHAAQIEEDGDDEDDVSPSRRKVRRNFTPLLKHEDGSQYCLDTFRTVKHRGEYYHVPGRPNPDTFKSAAARRKWLRETVKQLESKPSKKKRGSLKKRRGKKSSNKARSMHLAYHV